MGAVVEGGIASPAMTLLHEAIHAEHLISDLGAVFLRDNVPVSGFNNLEEQKTIEEANKVTTDLNEDLPVFEGTREVMMQLCYLYMEVLPVTYWRVNRRNK